MPRTRRPPTARIHDSAAAMPGSVPVWFRSLETGGANDPRASLHARVGERTVDGATGRQEEKSRQISELHEFIKADKGPLSVDDMKPMSVTQQDFVEAIPKVQPSAKREGFATVPDVTWENVGALTALRQKLHECILWQIQQPELYASAGLTAPTGVLLYGPPGCGKTLVAKAIANESRANFISIRGPELLNKVMRCN